jgi:hypothetical protein
MGVTIAGVNPDMSWPSHALMGGLALAGIPFGTSLCALP